MEIPEGDGQRPQVDTGTTQQRNDPPASQPARPQVDTGTRQEKSDPPPARPQVERGTVKR